MMTQILVKANARSKKGDILESYQALLQHHNVSWFLESIYILYIESIFCKMFVIPTWFGARCYLLVFQHLEK